ncbi:MAG TPA: ferritin-like domain-containing protein [Gemmataceae bacterium]|nr:ferritin-like domain-containing protein [Gemmataceae bacterium]
MATKSNLRDLLAIELQDAYSAETQLVKALPKMAKAATNPELRAGFEHHLSETRNHVGRLEQVAQEMDISLKGNKCEAMEGLVEEAKEVIDMNAEDEVRDAGLIAAAQKAEHYEIATYGTLCAWAKQLGLGSVATLLHQTLDEEKRTDEKLTRLAKQVVNLQAV